MAECHFESDVAALPKGAWSKTYRVPRFHPSKLTWFVYDWGTVTVKISEIGILRNSVMTES
jgi:hypothetical protein